MKTLLKRDRKAIAMIELIFAIVVIGIAMLSIPTLVTTATQSSAIVLQQEAINEASTKLSSILSFHWDEADTDTRFIDPIVQVNAGNLELNEYNSSGRRRGTPLNSLRTFIRADGTRVQASTTLGPEAGETSKDDMDDFNGEDVGLTLVEASTNDYVEKTTISIKTGVKYIQDSSATFQTTGLNFAPLINGTTSGTTNIKLISVTLTSTSGVNELNKTIVLRAFGCNIGAAELEVRRF